MPKELWFVVRTWFGQETPELWQLRPPIQVTGPHAKQLGITYVELLHGERRELPLSRLWAEYRRQAAYEAANARYPLPLSPWRA
jgi:hypothetical protein